MCGRFSITQQEQILEKRFNSRFYSEVLERRYNIAPTNLCPVITNEDPRYIRLFRWGLIPSWAKDPAIGNTMINARAESITEKPAFRNLFRNKRCLVIADGFFEWKAEGKNKRPFNIQLKERILFAFAGLWDCRKNEKGEEIYTFTIITTASNSLIRNVHDRMPVILEQENEAIWLSDESSNNDLLSLLRPYDAEKMELYPVSKLVNSPINDVPQILESSEDTNKLLF